MGNSVSPPPAVPANRLALREGGSFRPIPHRILKVPEKYGENNKGAPVPAPYFFCFSALFRFPRKIWIEPTGKIWIERTVRTDRCRPIGFFICKEREISAKEPNWAFLKLKNGRISGIILHLLRVAKFNSQEVQNYSRRVFSDITFLSERSSFCSTKNQKK